MLKQKTVFDSPTARRGVEPQLNLALAIVNRMSNWS